MNGLAMLAVLALGQGTAAPPAGSSTYTNEWIGISITHPADWKVAPKKQDAWITIPLKGGSMVAGLNLVAAVFQSETDVWQLSQEHVNKNLGFEVIRQWQEEILGVPFLLTKVRSGPGKLSSAVRAVPGLPSNEPLVTLIGLVYSATPRKLMFRLTAPEAGYDDAEFLLRKSLETIRTLDGKMPLPEDPDRKPDPQQPVPTAPPRPATRVTIGGPANSEKTAVRAPLVHEATAANRKIGFYYPSEWKLETGADGKLTLRSAEPAISLSLELHSTLDSDPPLRALIKASAASLKSFDKVARREENLPETNKAGAIVIRVWRTGTGASGPIWSFEAVGGSNDFYFLLKGQGTGALPADLRKAVEALVDQASVEPMG